jgi:hypothetical protein
MPMRRGAGDHPIYPNPAVFWFCNVVMAVQDLALDRTAASGWRLPYWPWGFAAIGIASLGILAAPLAAYVVLIAAFGLPHVLCELRYVDERFSARLPRGALLAIASLLAALVTLRLAQALAGLPGQLAMQLELGVGAALSLAAALTMKRHRALGFIAGIAITAGIVFAPVLTFLAFAWAHNLTPLAFVAEIAPREQRGRAVAMLAIPFFVWPAFIATGIPHDLMAQWTGHFASAAPSLFNAGREPISAFLPRDAAFEATLPLFSAAVAAQAMHYFAVIVMLPRLLKEHGGSGAPIVPWPRWGWFYAIVAGLAALVFATYAFAFPVARAYYGIAAAVHSWIELPIFLLALGGLAATPLVTARK